MKNANDNNNSLNIRPNSKHEGVSLMTCDLGSTTQSFKPLKIPVQAYTETVATVQTKSPHTVGYFFSSKFVRYVAAIVYCIYDVFSCIWPPIILLSLNSSETEFRLVGLPEQLSKIFNSVLHVCFDDSKAYVAPVRNLGVIFDSNMSVLSHLGCL
jgi:hypothetical protein